MELDHSYLDGLGDEQREQLLLVNRDAHELLAQLLADGNGIAFLGAGASAPLYPLWGALIDQLIDLSAGKLEPAAARTCRDLAADNPDAVVEILREQLGQTGYRELLRRVFLPRRDPETHRTWTPTHELVARCDFAGLVTTNYDPGILDARSKVRPRAQSTGFAAWTNDGALDRWRTGDVFNDDELPVLYAHGQHNDPDNIVLATTDYRRAYRHKLGRVLGRLADTSHLVWIGFSFADERIAAILHEIAEQSGSAEAPGQVPRHVAIMPWNPESASDPRVLRRLTELNYGSLPLLYPVFGDDHVALGRLLESVADQRFPALGQFEVHASAPARRRDPPSFPLTWAHGGEPPSSFVGRADELARVGRWSADPEVRLIGVTAWGGAGKTALVNEWINRWESAPPGRSVDGLFGWSFYEDNSVRHWIDALLDWAETELGFRSTADRSVGRALELIRTHALVLVLDGLETRQEGPTGQQFGRLLDGELRRIITGACGEGRSLFILTSRYPFADVEPFDGGTARILDVPALTPDEGATLLQTMGAGWLARDMLLELSAAVDGHALAVTVIGAVLREHPEEGLVAELRSSLSTVPRTDARVGHVLAFYSERLDEVGRTLVGLVSIFQRPVSIGTLLRLGQKPGLGVLPESIDATAVETLVRRNLDGLVTWHHGGTISAHPLVRDTFRSLVLTPAAAALASDISLSDLQGPVQTREDALRVVEMIELLVDSGDWTAAQDLCLARLTGKVLLHLLASSLGMRCMLAFTGTQARRDACAERLGADCLTTFLNDRGLYSMNSGYLVAARGVLEMAVEIGREMDEKDINITLVNVAECHLRLGATKLSLDAAADALEAARRRDDSASHGREESGIMAAALDLAGRTVEAERYFAAADQMVFAASDHRSNLYSVAGNRWAELLIKTGRVPAARSLAEAGLEVARRLGWHEDVARGERVLGLCALAEDDLETARRAMESAVRRFEDGDLLWEWGRALAELAETHRRAGRLDQAQGWCTDVARLAGTRGLVPLQADAIVTRANVQLDRAIRSGQAVQFEQAADDAQAALRLATKARRLPWQELSATRVLARLGEELGEDHSWSEAAATLRATLVPEGLAPIPFAGAKPQD